MEFSKAFDVVKHKDLSDKLKLLDVNPYLTNWYHSFLHNRKQRVICNSHVADWKNVNRGTTQGSVSGPYLFSVFINDLDIIDDKGNTVIIKYADDSTIISPVTLKNNVIIDNSAMYVKTFLDWTSINGMKCNPSKCKEIIFRKKHSVNEVYTQISQIPQTFN